MCVRFAFALMFLFIPGLTSASATDLFEIPSIDMRAIQQVIYDYQPGVTVRAYWLPPWRDRHYFPKTGKKPKLGRLEHFSVNPGRAPVPAKSFHRAWSTSSAFVNE
jgi:hypothetical protein